MSKILKISDAEGKTYTLEYTRKSVEVMERQGFILEDITKKPMTMIPLLFSGAFLAHHPTMKRSDIDAILEGIGNRNGLIEKLGEMYSEPIMALMGDGEPGEKGNLTWSVDW